MSECQRQAQEVASMLKAKKYTLKFALHSQKKLDTKPCVI